MEEEVVSGETERGELATGEHQGSAEDGGHGDYHGDDGDGDDDDDGYDYMMMLLLLLLMMMIEQTILICSQEPLENFNRLSKLPPCGRINGNDGSPEKFPCRLSCRTAERRLNGSSPTSRTTTTTRRTTTRRSTTTRRPTTTTTRRTTTRRPTTSRQPSTISDKETTLRRVHAR